jgi:xanthine dehydrogenase large subunit
VREALREAAAAFGPAGTSVDLASPATAEAVWWALTEARGVEDRGHLVEGKPGTRPDQPDPAAPVRRPESEVAQHLLTQV